MGFALAFFGLIYALTGSVSAQERKPTAQETIKFIQEKLLSCRPSWEYRKGVHISVHNVSLRIEIVRDVLVAIEEMTSEVALVRSPQKPLGKVSFLTTTRTKVDQLEASVGVEGTIVVLKCGVGECVSGQTRLTNIQKYEPDADENIIREGAPLSDGITITHPSVI